MMTSSHPDSWEPQPLTGVQVHDSTTLFELSPTRKISVQALRQLLPTTELALFFGKLYNLDYYKLSQLVRTLFDTDIITALIGEGDAHSTELQGYIVDTVPADVLRLAGSPVYDTKTPPPDTELLRQAFEELQTQVAASIQEVADKLGDVLSSFPSKYGTMTFEHLRTLNRQRNSLGTYSATIKHQHTPPRLVVLDVSGSVTAGTVRRLVGEVVSLAWGINASLAIVSNNTYHWEPGTFDEATVVQVAEFCGTHYETLTPLLQENWETVISIADYDSSSSAKRWISKHARGHIRQVLDISLVDRPTYLSQCLGTIADEVRPLLVGNTGYVLS